MNVSDFSKNGTDEKGRSCMPNSGISLSKNFVRTANWYVLKVRYDTEMKCAALLNERLGGRSYVFFVPTRDRTFRVGGTERIHRRRMFEKYVFLATSDSALMCYHELSRIIRNEADIFGFLYYGDDREAIKLHDRDRDFIASILNEEFNVPAIEVEFEGQNVILANGLLDDYRGVVKKINKYRRTAIVVVEVFGKLNEIELAITDLERV
jgi:transcriptional antiterminator NusG